MSDLSGIMALYSLLHTNVRLVMKSKPSAANTTVETYFVLTGSQDVWEKMQVVSDNHK